MLLEMAQLRSRMLGQSKRQDSAPALNPLLLSSSPGHVTEFDTFVSTQTKDPNPNGQEYSMSLCPSSSLRPPQSSAHLGGRSTRSPTPTERVHRVSDDIPLSHALHRPRSAERGGTSEGSVLVGMEERLRDLSSKASIYINQDPQGVVDGHFLISKGLSMEALRCSGIVITICGA